MAEAKPSKYAGHIVTLAEQAANNGWYPQGEPVNGDGSTAKPIGTKN